MTRWERVVVAALLGVISTPLPAGAEGGTTAKPSPQVAIAVVGDDVGRAAVEEALRAALEVVIGTPAGGTAAGGPHDLPTVTVDGAAIARWVLVDLHRLGKSAVQYTVRVRRPAGTLVRGGVAVSAELSRRVVADALLGLLADKPGAGRAPYVAVTSERGRGDLDGPLEIALRRRGFAIVPTHDLALAMAALPVRERGAERWQHVRRLLAADAVIVVDSTAKARGRVIVQATVFDAGVERGVARTAPATHAAAALATLAARISVGTGTGGTR